MKATMEPKKTEPKGGALLRVYRAIHAEIEASGRPTHATRLAFFRGVSARAGVTVEECEQLCARIQTFVTEAAIDYALKLAIRR